MRSEHLTTKQTDPARTIRELHELIAALDRRVPRVERVGELSIAQAAADLKIEALKRIEELERQEAPSTVYVFRSSPVVAGAAVVYCLVAR